MYIPITTLGTFYLCSKATIATDKNDLNLLIVRIQFCFFYILKISCNIFHPKNQNNLLEYNYFCYYKVNEPIFINYNELQ